MSAGPVRAAVVTGGHSFEVVLFHQLFGALDGVDAYVQHMEDFCADAGKCRGDYDAVVFYHMFKSSPCDEGPWYAGKQRTVLETLGETPQGIFLLHHAILAALHCFAAARQLADDASDWITDLQAGQLNYVSAHLMRRLYQRSLATNGIDLDTERLVGYQLVDEEFWADIEQTAQDLSQQALDHLAPYGDDRLQALIEHQMAQHTAQWAAGRTYRANIRQIFGKTD